MKFVNRKKEKELIEECKKLSNNKLFSICIFGLRRVGKTRLILELLQNDDLYFFVNKDKQSQSLLKEYETTLKNARIMSELESLNNWDNFFKVLFERYKGIIAFDEFQNFSSVEMSIFGILQKNIDLKENSKGILLIFSGSTIGLIKKIFFDGKEPLYGRIKRKLHLKPLSFFEIVEMCSELGIKNLEQIIILYAVFGGFPKYYSAIEDEKLEGRKPSEIFDRFFFNENAVFEDEVSSILSLEFGKRGGLYYDILASVATGSTRISEIASELRKKETALTRQINELVNYFNLIGIKKQVIGDKTIMFIEHPLIDFWLRFFYKNLSLYKRRDTELISKIKNDLNLYVSKRFEDVCIEIVTNSTLMPLKFTSIGNQWGKFKGEKGKNTYEIDIVGVNEDSKEILFAECKWQEHVDAEAVLLDLQEKSKYVDWNKGNRKEYFAVFAKSFNKKIKNAYDLIDLEEILAR